MEKEEKKEDEERCQEEEDGDGIIRIRGERGRSGEGEGGGGGGVEGGEGKGGTGRGREGGGRVRRKVKKEGGEERRKGEYIGNCSLKDLLHCRCHGWARTSFHPTEFLIGQGGGEDMKIS